MVKSRTAQIVYETIYVVLGLIGVMTSLGYFSASFRPTFFVYFTNLSNYLCVIAMIISLCWVCKKAKNHEDGPITFAPGFKFMCNMSILLTCLVFNIMLVPEGGITLSEYFLNFDYFLLHTVLPVMFVLDWIIFYKHGTSKWPIPLYSLIIPICYLIFALVRATIIKNVLGTAETASVIYPYYFLNVDELGVWGVVMWVAILIVAYVGVGYILWALDSIPRFKAKRKAQDVEELPKE
ncbi:MAG: Pr6Pr family membrane protein [Coprobacillus sp.]|nr:Pr6Pr family membrane protein [Coprobacillus sp.]